MLRALTAPHFLLALVLAGPVTAQERPFPYTLGSPDAVLAPLGLGLTILGDHIQGDAPLTRSQVAALDANAINAFDRVATRTWSRAWARRSDRSRDGILAAGAVVAFAAPVLDGRWADAAAMGVIFAESYLLLRGTTYTVKRATGRERPYLYNTDLSLDERAALALGDDEGPSESFYSGHTAAAFTVAALASTVFADVNGRSRRSDALWAASLSAAAFTGFARVKAGKHYPSDVIVGAVVGTAIGTLVPRLHRRGATGPARLVATPGGFAVRLRAP